MIGSSTIRRCVCLLVALCLCAPMIAVAAPAVGRDVPTEFCTLAAPPANVLLARTGGRQDQSRKPASPFFLIPVLQRAGEPDLVQLAAATRQSAPLCLLTAGPRTGRSPPAIS